MIGNEHFEYERGMMQACYRHMLASYDPFMFNVLHESFMVHAYNLMIYLPDTDTESEEYKERLKYKKMINDQVRTLVIDRRTITNKLDMRKGDHKRIFELVNDQLIKEGYQAIVVPVSEDRFAYTK